MRYLVLRNNLIKTKLKKHIESLNAELNRAKTNYYEIRESFSFKLGYDLVHAIAKPGRNTFAFPIRLFKNIKSLHLLHEATCFLLRNN